MKNKRITEKNGIAIILVLFLLLIISTLTLSLFYMQILEVDIIAYEANYLQAFYLANAALEQGLQYINNFYINFTNSSSSQEIPDPPNYPLEAKFDFENNGHLAITASFKYQPDAQDPNIITVIGTASVNNISRTLEHDIKVSTSPLSPGIELPPDNPLLAEVFTEIQKLKTILNDPTVLAIENINLNGVLGTIEPKKILTDNKNILMQGVEYVDEAKQSQAIDEYQDKSVSWINQSMWITENNNRLIFSRDDDNLSERYEDLPLGQKVIDSVGYGTNWKYPFDYREDRAITFINGQKQIIIKPEMMVKKNQVLSLDPGVYYFSKLTLDTGSTIKTKGAVTIYTTKCELKEGAKLIGGKDNAPEAYPQNLVILIESTLNYQTPYIKLEARSEVYGHIVALNGLVNITNGIGSDNSQIQGSVLSKYLNITKQHNNGSYRIGLSPNIQTSGSSILVQSIPGTWREV